MAVQDRPVCFGCAETIEHSPVFEALCGHVGCPSASWHGLCLMEFYEKRESGERFDAVVFISRPYTQEHTEHG